MKQQSPTPEVSTIHYSGSTQLKHLDADFQDNVDSAQSLESEDHAKHLYACFGLAIREAQLYEDVFKTVLFACRRLSGRIPNNDMQDPEGRLSKFTLNSTYELLTEMHIVLDTDLKRMTLDSIDRRNELAHGFYIREAADLENHTSREALIRQLAEDAQLFRNTRKIFDQLLDRVASHCGLDMSLIREHH